MFVRLYLKGSAVAECCGYQYPDFQDGYDLTCCQYVASEFPFNYNPLQDGWVYNNTIISYDGSGCWATPELLLDWVNQNDPLNHNWTVEPDGDGYKFCARIKDEEKGVYGGLIHPSDPCFLCVFEGVFPFSGWDPESHGIVIDGGMFSWPASEGGVWETPQDLADWMNGLFVNGSWEPYISDLRANEWKICSFVDQRTKDVFQGFSVPGSEWTCITDRIFFPFNWESGDGFIVDDKLVPFTGDGVFRTPEEFLQWLNDNDPNNNSWIANDLNDGSYSICSFVEEGDYKSLFIQPSPVCICEVNNLEFPWEYDQVSAGWRVNGEIIPFGGSGTWLTATELASWMTENDPNGNTWFANKDPIKGWNICSFVNDDQIDLYGGLTESAKCCLDLPLDPFVDDIYPYFYGQGFGWGVGTDFLLYGEEGEPGFIWSGSELANWMTQNDVNGNVWYEYPQGSGTFCSPMTAAECVQYVGNDVISVPGLVNAEKFCFDKDYEFPFNYQDCFDGWQIQTSFIPYPAGGVWGSVNDLTSWLSDNDPANNLWFSEPVFGGCSYRICTFRIDENDSGVSYGIPSCPPVSKYCPFTSLSFPLYWDGADSGVEINGESFFFGSDVGQFEKPEDFLSWLDSTWPNTDLAEFYLETSNGDDWNFCLDSPNFLHYPASFVGDVSDTVSKYCPFTSLTFPLRWFNSESGVEINGDSFFFEGNCGEFEKVDDFVAWLSDKWPNTDFADFYAENSGSATNSWNICLESPNFLHYPASFVGDVSDSVLQCEVVNYNFPRAYTLPGDGWVVNGLNIEFPGEVNQNDDGDDVATVNRFHSACLMADWMTSNDPFKYVWKEVRNADGTYNICAYVDGFNAGAYVGNID